MTVYAMDALDNYVREELPSVINESLPSLCPVYKRIASTSMGVSRDNIGRSWKVIHLYGGGVAGLMESGEPLGPSLIDIGKQSRLLDPNLVDTSNLTPFPNAAEAPHTGSLKRELSLHKVLGNFNIPITWMQGDALDSSQIDEVVRDVKAVGMLRAMIETASFFGYAATDANDSTKSVRVLGRVSAIAENSTTADYIDITIDEEYGRISNFRNGMRIDIVADSGSTTIESGTAVDGSDVRNYTHTTQKYVWLIVVNVDYLGKKITLAPVNSDTGAKPNYYVGDSGSSGDVFQDGNGGAALDWLVLSRCSRTTTGRPMYTWGLENWLKSSGTVMGGASAAEALDVDVYSQFKSQVVAVNGPLTDTVMNNYIGGFLDAYPGQTLDTIITTQGVTMKYIENTTLWNSRQIYDRTGKTVDVAGGWDEVTYSFNGRKLTWMISPTALKKRLYGLKLGGGNIKRYVPPRVGGVDGRVSSELEFLAPLGGHRGIFKIAHADSGASMEMLEAPFWEYKLIAPVDVKGVKLTGLTESTMT